MATSTKSAATIPESTKSEINSFVQQWEKLAGAYFWTPPSSASARRSYEKYQSRDISITIDSTVIEGSISVSCSCRNVYVTRKLVVNGEQKRITALKNLIK